MMTPNLSPGLVVVAALVYYAGLWYWSSTRLRSRGLRLPPGPKPKFITGNLYQIPRLHPWLTYRAWAKEYGPIMYYRVFNKETIILSSAKVALDLLESRATIYSNRPTLWMGGELGGRKKSVFITQFSDPRFKLYRRLLQTGLNPRAAKSYEPIQIQETQILLQNLLNAPDDFKIHIRRNAVAIILKVAYGYQVESNDDPLVQLIEETFKLGGIVNVPGKFWVEYFPALRFLPDWFPGAGFKKLARDVGKERSKVDHVPFSWARKEIEKGDYVESFVSKHTVNPEGGETIDEETLDAIERTASALYIGGGDTTVSALTSFVLLMALNPEIQKQAQEDVDKVASGRLPTLDDYDSLPLVKAIIKETLRWAPVAPLGIPHHAMEDDVYQGYFIPKGATITANIWAITHDEEIYPDPFKFDPSRHLGTKAQPDPFKFVFGFGRRICPGAHLAEMSLFLSISNILAVFDISKPLDKDGKEYEPEIEWTSGTTMHMKSFPCRIKPRSKEHLMLLG
ncbi:cytochrome P450 [Agrocybe pediades]|nr:cytochrome P450 [Agrocybe pediades]